MGFPGFDNDNVDGLSERTQKWSRGEDHSQAQRFGGGLICNCQGLGAQVRELAALLRVLWLGVGVGVDRIFLCNPAQLGTKGPLPPKGWNFSTWGFLSLGGRHIEGGEAK